jgi:hypothetical protein
MDGVYMVLLLGCANSSLATSSMLAALKAQQLEHRAS